MEEMGGGITNCKALFQFSGRKYLVESSPLGGVRVHGYGGFSRLEQLTLGVENFDSGTALLETKSSSSGRARLGRDATKNKKEL